MSLKLTVDPRASDDFAKLFKHVPWNSPGDESLVILKGHLLIEEQLREYINTHMHSPEYLEDARLTFHQCVCLARSLAGTEFPSSLWEVLLKLNALRNQYSHNLEPREIQNRIDEFVELVESHVGKRLPTTTEVTGRLPLAIYGAFVTLNIALRVTVAPIDGTGG